MPNLYKMNSYIEYELESYPKPLSIKTFLLHYNQSLQYLFWAISQKEDAILIDGEIDESLLDFWKTIGLEYASLYSSSKILVDYNLVEWGNTSKLENGNIVLDKTKIESLKDLNSKKNQSFWKSKSGLGILDSKVIYSVEELEKYLSTVETVVLKKEFGLSGSNAILLNKGDFIPFTEFQFKITPDDFPLVVEKWVGSTRVMDFSSIYEVNNGKWLWLCSTQMLIDEKGKYLGSILSPAIDEQIYQIYKDDWFSQLGIAYTGPLSVDGFVFKDNNELKVQKVSEINFRYTMGRVLYELSKKRNANKLCEYSTIFRLEPATLKELAQLNYTEIAKLFKEKYNAFFIPLTPISHSKKKPQFVWAYMEKLS